MIEWDIVLALVIAAAGFGYGFGSRAWRREFQRLFGARDVDA